MAYVIKITNKNNDPNNASLSKLYLDSIAPSLIINPDTPYSNYESDMALSDGSVLVPLYQRQQFVKIPISSVLVINTDNSDEAIYYAQCKVNNSAILVDPDPFGGSSGGGTLIEKTITENGTYNAVDDDADGYSTVNVEVENSYTAEDNGKVVSNQALVAQTAYPTTITENDTYDTTNYNSITVNVSGGGAEFVAAETFDYASDHMDLLKTIDIPDGTVSIQYYCFSSCTNLESVSIPSSVQYIGSYAFNECPKLTSISISNGVTTIPEAMCLGCTALTSVHMPNTIQYIQDNAFYGCTSLESITIPAGVLSIGDGCFYNCSSLSSIIIPSSVTQMYGSAFEACESLESMTFESSTPPQIGDGTLGGYEGLPTTCIIRVPRGSRSAYTSAEYYPDPNTYTYEEY